MVNVAIHIACALLLFAIVRRTLIFSTGDGARRPARLKPRAPYQPTRPTRLTDPPDPPDLARPTRPTPRSLRRPSGFCTRLTSEPADYVTARSESLMAFFLLLTLYCAIRSYRDRTIVWDALAVMRVRPRDALQGNDGRGATPRGRVMTGHFASRSLRDAWRQRRRLYAGLAACWAVLAWIVWQGPRSGSVGLRADAGLVQVTSVPTYLLNQVVMLARYVKLALVPSGSRSGLWPSAFADAASTSSCPASLSFSLSSP